MSRVRRALVALVCSAAVAVLGGCGVPLQDQAQPLPSGALPPSQPPPEPSPSADLTRVYFASGPVLEGVPEPLADRSPNGIMAALSAGPIGTDVADLRTLLNDPLTGLPMLYVETWGEDDVVLRSTEAFPLVQAFDQVLLVGQVVHSMDQVGVSRVVILDPSGNDLALPLPDGTLKDGAVTAKDYASLLSG